MSAGVLLAGGTGRRFGSPLPKQLLLLEGEPLVARSLRILDEEPKLSVLVVVAHPQWLDALTEIAAAVVSSSKLVMVPGGASRNDSARIAIQAIDADQDVVLVHDGARPLVTAELVGAALAAIDGADAVLPVIETVDLIARVQGDRVTGFADRTLLWRGQSPQVFRRRQILAALEHATSKGIDHATLYEALLAWAPDAHIRAIPGDVHNLKLTVPVDELIARTIADSHRAPPAGSDVG